MGELSNENMFMSFTTFFLLICYTSQGDFLQSSVNLRCQEISLMALE